MIREPKLLSFNQGKTNQQVPPVNKNTEISVESSVFLFIDELEMREQSQGLGLLNQV